MGNSLCSACQKLNADVCGRCHRLSRERIEDLEEALRVCRDALRYSDRQSEHDWHARQIRKADIALCDHDRSKVQSCVKCDPRARS